MDLLLEKKWPEAAIFVVPQNQTQKRILLTVSQPLPSLHLHPYRELFAFFDPDIVFVRSSLWSCSADYCPFSPWHSFIVLFLRYELITESTWKIKYYCLKRKILWSKIFNMTRPKPAYGRQGLDWDQVIKKRYVTNAGSQLTSID